jgi:ATP-dependent Clp protease adapter protein ClpS
VRDWRERWAHAASSGSVGDRTVRDETAEQTAREIETEIAEDALWRVILFNDEVHTFNEVIVQLQLATGCSQARAEALTWRVHTHGQAVVHEDDFEGCFRVQQVLRRIELITEIRG